MKKFLVFIAISFALLACAKIPDIQLPEGDSNVQIGVFVAGRGAGTKGSVSQITDGSPGETVYNENYLKTLDFFFYLEGSEDDDGFDYQNNQLPSASAIHYIHKDNVDANTTWTLYDIADRSVLNAIFANGDRCIVYVIANYTPETPFSGTEKRITLRQMVAESNFNRVSVDGEGTPTGEGTPQASFVMEGRTEIQRTEIDGLYYVSGTVPLYRSVSKVRLEVTLPESLYDAGDSEHPDTHPDRRVKDGNGFTWIPQPAGMKAVLVHGVKKGVVCAMDESYRYDFVNTSDNYFAEVSSNTLLDDYGHLMHETKTTKDVNEEIISRSYEHKVPMYSYPTQNWKNDAAKETHMTLMLPWARLNDDGTINKVANTFYQIPIAVNPSDPTYQLKPNRYYRMEVILGSLGSFELDDMVNLYPSTYVVLNWCTMENDDSEAHSNVSMSQTSYLAVAAHRDTLNNIPSHGVGYASSHPVTVQISKIEYLDYKNKVIRMARITSAQPNRIYYYTKNPSTGEWDVEESHENVNGIYGTYVANSTTQDGYITLTHDIPSTMYTPVNVYVTVSNGVVQPEEIVFTQYPPISIEGNLSNGVVFVNRQQNNESGNVFNYTGEWIGYLTRSSDAAGLTLTEGNTNPMLYSIKISSFSSGDDYVLGDPRVLSPDNNLDNSSSAWSGPVSFYFSEAEAASHGSYFAENGTFYYSYQEWYSNQTIITREQEETSSSYSNVTSNWGSYTSEKSAYGPDSDGYYYWRTGGMFSRVYHRTRYSYTGTRYVVGECLTNYHPTNPTEETENMIAPEILIASSYGKTRYKQSSGGYDMTLSRAKMRCALYQEDGYPAGRWRLPTFAEVKFIMSLSTTETIPELFTMNTPTDTEGYWCANGKVVLRNNVVQLETNNTTPTAPRCVYDLWYWGEDHDTYATTWHLGDND